MCRGHRVPYLTNILPCIFHLKKATAQGGMVLGEMANYQLLGLLPHVLPYKASNLAVGVTGDMLWGALLSTLISQLGMNPEGEFNIIGS